MIHTIDCKGLKCPQPVINTKKYFDSIKEGEALIIVDNEVAKNNICKFAQSNGYKYKAVDSEGLFNINITKEDCHCEIMKFDKKLVIVVGTDKLGEGEEVLGANLMKSYMYALSESDDMPSDIIFLNSGVKLTTKGSSVIDSLEELKNKGVNITSCGTCLDFYNLKDDLLIGDISNMYTIVETMNKSDNTIKL
ncbi:sulfurtransferase-like selenium metabolism protein YedF [Clostridium algidicarnis]|uniref:Selenium metabolism protein YedF n=2 Tax=Clostridium algidicarnis TaxID=37659 RepID=A0A2S6FWG3_9CLOT|nr:sulfurtransferase-like selenium metabolism protein YedF [Clostridium algidicarnis]MBB6632033.1 sulfurtransferase-like selenium metabolism protein YedF [Clostridium algidicarnis]MBB6697297.1 sulfurtransferase-like selenium metabolism protein YedF [Clostridium algidicarnis]MBU3194562.1 sulfurtransferase-like selenium metabolism protein YedF [Clostridium algidicarnis]MBU3202567.1 sulfurtransferase-like selenium metabolism protein YedF [Clostridium algidicarnis]MBU3206963.1 sulfurtransferase-li